MEGLPRTPLSPPPPLVSMAPIKSSPEGGLSNPNGFISDVDHFGEIPHFLHLQKVALFTSLLLPPILLAFSSVQLGSHVIPVLGHIFPRDTQPLLLLFVSFLFRINTRWTPTAAAPPRTPRSVVLR